MPEQVTESTPGQLGLAQWPRRLMWALACVLLPGSIPAAVFAQTVPSALRVCAATTDPGQRLDCYDREMARLLARHKQPAAGASTTDLPGSVTPMQAFSPAPSAATVAKSPDAEPAPGGSSAAHRSSVWKIFSGGGTPALTAHIARLERWPNAMVLHLDNGQVWQQVGRASGDLGLQAGDSVRIDKHLGSYWLSSGHVSDMQVRLKSQ